MGVKSDYRAKLNELYKVAVNSVDFSNRETPGVINNWVNNATRGLITEIVSPGKKIIVYLYKNYISSSKNHKNPLQKQFCVCLLFAVIINVFKTKYVVKAITYTKNPVRRTMKCYLYLKFTDAEHF